MDGSKSEIQLLKTKLENLSQDYELKLEKLDSEEQEIIKLREMTDRILKRNPNQVMKLNFGGRVMKTYLNSLFSVDNCLFYYLIDESTDLNEEIFFEKDPDVFEYILEFFRKKTLNIERIKKKNYYKEVLEMSVYFGCYNEMIKLKLLSPVNMNRLAGPLITDGNIVLPYMNEKYEITSLNNIDLSKGVFTDRGGSISLQFNSEFVCNAVKIGGFSHFLLNGFHGQGSIISASLDGLAWEKVGEVPKELGSTIKEVKIKKTRLKYLKIESQSFLGIGYIGLA